MSEEIESNMLRASQIQLISALDISSSFKGADGSLNKMGGSLSSLNKATISVVKAVTDMGLAITRTITALGFLQNDMK